MDDQTYAEIQEKLIIQEELIKAGQEHVLKYWEQLDVEEKNELLKQIENIDLHAVNEMFETAKNGADAVDDQVSPLLDEICAGLGRSSEEQIEAWQEVGLKAVGRGEVGVVLLGGGQATRMGEARPKALYNLPIPSRKSLMEIQAERVRKMEMMAGDGAKIAWYVMVNPQTKDEIRGFLEKHKYFGLERDQVVVFSQGTLPCLDFDGKMMMKGPGEVSLAPDGNGGMYKAMKEQGVIVDMVERGVKHVFVYCVDNVLVKVADPAFIGACIEKGVECGNKVVQRRKGEKVGVTCMVNGAGKVMEYSEIPEEIANEESEGGLRLNAANICEHYFAREFLGRVAMQEEALPAHIARKKIECIDEGEEVVDPEEPNGIKLEKFVFDAFPMAERFLVWWGERESEFEPLKNGTGKVGTAETCTKAMYKLHSSWLRRAGAEIVNEDGEVVEEEDEGNEVVEVSPMVSYAGEGLKELVGGKSLATPLYLTENKNYF